MVLRRKVSVTYCATHTGNTGMMYRRKIHVKTEYSRHLHASRRIIHTYWTIEYKCRDIYTVHVWQNEMLASVDVKWHHHVIVCVPSEVFLFVYHFFLFFIVITFFFLTLEKNVRFFYIEALGMSQSNTAKNKIYRNTARW